MSSYLYGASVQGIQDFIFKTNKLQEVVGASELIKSIEELFETFAADEILLNAAGNIKAVFHSKEACEKVVLEFGKKVMQQCYGITISQAVVLFEREPQKHFSELERRLKIQRNKPSIPLDKSINLMKLAPTTAKPAVKKEQDKATTQKLEAYKQWLEKNPHNKLFSDISKFSNAKNKIAVVHIDGNGLGQLIPKLSIPLKEFSQKLDKATKTAFKDAQDEKMRLREIILGGDDVTVVINADDALRFTQNFLEKFEEYTAQAFGRDKQLTACAGIAFCNEKYPFHYAVALAEELCVVAKKDAKMVHKDKAPSALMFHNIQSANFESWELFVANELMICNEKETLYLDFGPYYLRDEFQKPTIANFLNTLEAYRCEGSPIRRLREWLSELHKSHTNAKILLNRINTIVKQKNTWNCDIMNKNLKFFNKKLSNDTLIIEKDNKKKTPVYDILQILSATEHTK